MHTLEEAQSYIEQNRIDKRKRPAFHVTAPVGWINDPNGFSTYQNKVHLFYQYHPYSTNWGPMHWGHVVSSDMIKWEERPVALAPDQAYDHAGVFQEVLWKRQKDMFLSTQVSKKKKMTLAIKLLTKHSLLQSVTAKITTKFPKPCYPWQPTPRRLQSIRF